MIFEITQEKVLRNFNILATLVNELHKDLVENGFKRVDKKNDIEIRLGDKLYWVTTKPIIREWSTELYSVEINFKIKEGSKYGETLYEFTR